MSIQFLKEYLKKRKKARFFEKLIELGRNGESKIDSMINARLLKPSELQMDEAIQDANKLHQKVLTLLQDKEISILLDDNKVNIDYIKNLKFEKMTQCKSIYSICSEIGIFGQRKLGGLFLMAGGFTIVEIFAGAILMGVLLEVIKIGGISYVWN